MNCAVASTQDQGRSLHGVIDAFRHNVNNRRRSTGSSCAVCSTKANQLQVTDSTCGTPEVVEKSLSNAQESRARMRRSSK